MTAIGRTFALRLGRLERLAFSPTVVWLTAAFAVGLALRLVWVFYMGTQPLGGDPHWYYIVAINMAKGYGFVSNSGTSVLGESIGPGEPTAFWPPAYSFLLAGFWRVFGIDLDSLDALLTSAKVLNAILGAAAIPFVYLLGRQVFTPRVGLVSAGVFAVFPNTIAWTPLLFSEQLFILLFVAALWLALIVPTASRVLWVLAGFGLLTALAVLTRGQGAVLVPVAVVFWWMRSGWRPALRWSAMSLVVAVAVIAPWTVRNWIEMDAFIPVSTNTGAALRVGHHADSTGTTEWTDEVIDGFRMEESLYRPEWEVKGYREYTSRAIDYAFTHPGHEVELSGLKIYHLYRSDSVVIPFLTTLGTTPFEPGGLGGALRWLFDVSHYILLFGAILSIPFWARRDAARMMLLSVTFFWTLFHVAFLGEPRYHLPLVPIFCIALVAGAAAGLGRLAEWRERRAPTAALHSNPTSH